MIQICIFSVVESSKFTKRRTEVYHISWKKGVTFLDAHFQLVILWFHLCLSACLSNCLSVYLSACLPVSQFFQKLLITFFCSFIWCYQSIILKNWQNSHLAIFAWKGQKMTQKEGYLFFAKSSLIKFFKSITPKM